MKLKRGLRKECDIPIFHDDQHGTAIVTAAGLINALILANKKIGDIRVVANGAGAAGVAIVKLLLNMGVKIMALIQQESGGRHLDVMQSSGVTRFSINAFA